MAAKESSLSLLFFFYFIFVFVFLPFCILTVRESRSIGITFRNVFDFRVLADNEWAKFEIRLVIIYIRSFIEDSRFIVVIVA
jgi:hypothetical protein